MGHVSEIQPQVGTHLNSIFCTFTGWSTAGYQGLRRIIYCDNIATDRRQKEARYKTALLIMSARVFPGLQYRGAGQMIFIWCTKHDE